MGAPHSQQTRRSVGPPVAARFDVFYAGFRLRRAGLMLVPIFTYTQHARDQIALRSLDQAWVERTILAPDAVEPGPRHPDRRRAFRALPERDGRVLRLVYVVRSAATFHGITAFLDRGRRPGTHEIPV